MEAQCWMKMKQQKEQMKRQQKTDRIRDGEKGILF
jgi:hypothetical protein